MKHLHEEIFPFHIQTSTNICLFLDNNNKQLTFKIQKEGKYNTNNYWFWIDIILNKEKDKQNNILEKSEIKIYDWEEENIYYDNNDNMIEHVTDLV